MMSAIDAKVKILDENKIVEILGYEIRKDATYIIVENGDLESKINILNEGKVFEVIR